jgi:hypothetical protein
MVFDANKISEAVRAIEDERVKIREAILAAFPDSSGVNVGVERTGREIIITSTIIIPVIEKDA